MVAWIIPILFLLFLVSIPLVSSYQVLRDLLKYFFSDWYNLNLFFTKVYPERRDFLAKNFNYYKTLSERNRQTVERRVQKFIGMQSFETPSGGRVRGSSPAAVHGPQRAGRCG